MTVQVLEPPYQQASPSGLIHPAVGSVLIADLSDGIPALANALQHAREAPWCPLVCLVADHRVTLPTLTTFEPVPGTWATLHPSDYRHLPPPQRVRAAIRRRPAPQVPIIAQWVEGRLRRPGSASVLAACFGEGGDALRPPRTLTRRVHALGPLEVRDWRGLARLAQVVSARASLNGAHPLETTAYEANIDPRTLRRWLRLATDLCWGEAIGRIGWEWILESALRRYGYVERRDVWRVSVGYAREQ